MNDSTSMIYSTDDTVTFVVPRRTGGYVIGLHRKVCLLDWDTAKTTTVAEIDKKGLNNRLNDEKCDPLGRLWCGQCCAFIFNYGPLESLL